MARGRKAQYINKLTSKDQNMLRAFKSVGYLSKAQLKEQLQMSERRIQNFLRDKHIELVSTFDKHTKTITEVYRLTEKGQEFTAQHMNLSNFYRSVSVQHDLALAHTYFHATTEQRQNWMTEKDWRDRLEQHIEQLHEKGYNDRADELTKMWEEKRLSLPDGGYVIGETVVCVEIITQNYGPAEIEAKIEFTKAIDAEYQPYKI